MVALVDTRIAVDLRIAVDPRIAGDLRKVPLALDVATEITSSHTHRGNSHQRADAMKCAARDNLGVAFDELVFLDGHKTLHRLSGGPRGERRVEVCYDNRSI